MPDHHPPVPDRASPRPSVTASSGRRPTQPVDPSWLGIFDRWVGGWGPSSLPAVHLVVLLSAVLSVLELTRTLVTAQLGLGVVGRNVQNVLTALNLPYHLPPVAALLASTPVFLTIVLALALLAGIGWLEWRRPRSPRSLLIYAVLTILALVLMAVVAASALAPLQALQHIILQLAR